MIGSNKHKLTRKILHRFEKTKTAEQLIAKK